jgi:hypothetical protein
MHKIFVVVAHDAAMVGDIEEEVQALGGKWAYGDRVAQVN